jgi:hypothetical protein
LEVYDISLEGWYCSLETRKVSKTVEAHRILKDSDREWQGEGGFD